MKKTAILCAMMLVMAATCSTVFAGTWYDGHYYNGEISGQVGIGDGTGYQGWNVVNGTGAVADDRATNFTVTGNVGIYSGYVNNNEITSGVGAAIGWTDSAVATGNVGLFTNSNFNKIESAQGAVIDAGVGNHATGQVGVFNNSYNNTIANKVDGQNTYISIGAYVQGGNNNTANGNVGMFTNAGSGPLGSTWTQENVPTQNGATPGNTVIASVGAEIVNGAHNTATGNVGIFSGTTYSIPTDSVYPLVSSVNQNTVTSSTGAYITGGGQWNTAIGTVGSFTGNQTRNDVTGAGAQIFAGNHNYAVGTVGTFTGTGDWNKVTGNGAIIYGGNNNLAFGTVGQFSGNMAQHNTVNGAGAVIVHN